MLLARLDSGSCQPSCRFRKTGVAPAARQAARRQSLLVPLKQPQVPRPMNSSVPRAASSSTAMAAAGADRQSGQAQVWSQPQQHRTNLGTVQVLVIAAFAYPVLKPGPPGDCDGAERPETARRFAIRGSRALPGCYRRSAVMLSSVVRERHADVMTVASAETRAASSRRSVVAPRRMQRCPCSRSVISPAGGGPRPVVVMSGFEAWLERDHVRTGSCGHGRAVRGAWPGR
jgi:hypothetical protein